MKQTALERAFDLASHGTVNGIGELRKTLNAEGYSHAQITGRALVGQLNAIIKARKDREASRVSTD